MVAVQAFPEIELLSVAEPQRERLDYIDGLRALAALGVIVCHTEMKNVLSGWHVLVDLGHGVELFFVLSGFCLAYPTLRKRRFAGAYEFDVRRFAVNRIIRILPPYYIATALLIGIGVLSWLHGGAFTVPGALPWHARDIAGALFLLDRHVRLASPVYWTLLVEARWYLLFPALLALWMRTPRVFLITLALVEIAFLATAARSLDMGTLPAFMLGIVAADVSVCNHAFARYALPAGAIATIGAVLLEPYIANQLIPQSNPGWDLAMFCLVSGAGTSGALRRALSFRPLVFLGIASYSVYLMHYPIVMAIGAVYRGTPVAFALTVAAALAGGLAFYFAVERWFCSGPFRARLYACVDGPVGAIAAWAGRSARSGVGLALMDAEGVSVGIGAHREVAHGRLHDVADDCAARAK